MTETEPTFDEPTDGTERANIRVEELGGLPEDNPFADIVREMREEGESWRDTYDTLDEVWCVVDKAAYEEGFELMAEWRVAVVVDDPNSTSGERYEYHEQTAETAEEAEEMVEDFTGWRVASEKTEQVGYCKVG